MNIVQFQQNLRINNIILVIMYGGFVLSHKVHSMILEMKLSAFQEIMTDRITNRRTDWVKGQLHFH